MYLESYDFIGISLDNQTKLAVKLLSGIADLLAQTADLETQGAAFYALRTILLNGKSTFFGTKAQYPAAAIKFINVLPSILVTINWEVRHSVVELIVDLLQFGKSTRVLSP